jgi:outer membrane lipoprotein SlyB
MNHSKCSSIFVAAMAAVGLAACTTPPPYSDTSGYPGSYPTSQYPSYPDYRTARWGYVEAVEVVPGETHSTGIGGTGIGVGAIGGAIAGGVLGNQVGHGTGRAAATVGGAVVGGIVGNEVEKRVSPRTDTPTLYRFRVRMEDGSYQTFTQETHENIRPGDRVRIDNGRVWPA